VSAPQAGRARRATLALVLALFASTAGAETYWGLQAERAEYRFGSEDTVLAVEFDAFRGTDEFKLRYTNETEYSIKQSQLELFEHRLFGQVPISDFFDAKAGIRIDAPKGVNRYYGVIGIQGLAPQWFEVDLDLFASTRGDLSVRLDAEYELLITNRLILTAGLEFDLPFSDDVQTGVGGWGPKLETGLRLSYDLIDRSVAPYIGVHYEEVFGKSADLARQEGEDVGEVFFVTGVRLSF
jgi:copper resistance protein B